MNDETTGRRDPEIVIRLPNVRAWLQDQLPDEFFDHMRAARREQLLAMRTLLDAAIERLDRPSTPARRRTRVDIAVE